MSSSALASYARKFTYSWEDAEDAAQDCLLASLRYGIDDRPWLFAVVRNAAHLTRRRGSHTSGIQAREYVQLDPIAECVELREVDPDERLDTLAALRLLKPDEARALLLLLAGWSYREIAEREGWTYTKVNRCIAEGRSRARSYVA